MLGGAWGEVEEVEGERALEEEERDEELRVESPILAGEGGEEGVEPKLDDRVVTERVVPEDQGQAVDDADHDDR